MGLSNSLTLLWRGGELGAVESGDFAVLKTGNLDFGKESSLEELIKGFLGLGGEILVVSSPIKGFPFLFLELRNGFLELEDGGGI